MSKNRKEYFKNYNREYYLKHLEERTEYFKNYRNNSKEKISERKKKYYKNNQSSNKILTELEEWLKQEIENIKTNYSQVNGNYFNMNYKIEAYEEVLGKIQELKEKYK